MELRDLNFCLQPLSAKGRLGPVSQAGLQRLKLEFKLLTNYKQLRMTAADGKVYSTDCPNPEE